MKNGTLQDSSEIGVYVDHRGDKNMRLSNKGSVKELPDDSRLGRKGNDIRNCIKERR